MKPRSILWLAGLLLASVALYFFTRPASLESADLRKDARAPAALPAVAAVSSPRLKQGAQPSPLLSNVAAYKAELSRLKGCYGGGCAYPETDPHSYEFALGQDLRSTLLGLAQIARAQSLVSDELSQLGREFLDNQDGYVQEAALALLGTQPVSRESLQAILQFVVGGFDAQLLPAALAELSRYRQQTEQEQIDSAFAQAMLTGAPFVGAFLSKSILPFLSDANVRFYRELYDRLPAGSVYRANLEVALQQFQQGGAR